MASLPLLALAACAWLAWLAWRARRALLRGVRAFWLARRIPGPAAGVLGFVGPLEDILDKARDAQRRYGNTVRLWAWPIVTITVTEPEDVEVLLSGPHAQDKPSIVYDNLKPLLDDGLLSLEKVAHRRHRKALTPSLHLEILQDFVPAFERNALALCRQLERVAASGEVVNMMPLLSSYSAHSICDTVFSTEYDTPVLERAKEDFARVLMEAVEIVFYRMMKPWYRSDAIFYFSSKHKPYHEAARGFNTFAAAMLRYKRDQLAQGPPARPEKGRRRLAFLDHLLTSAEGLVLSEAEMIAELKTLSGAAVGTTADLMGCLFIVLSLLPDVQDKIVKELDDVFAGSERAVEYDDLGHLQYLERVVKETLRLYPPVFAISRDVVADVALPSGHLLPAGCVAAFMPYFTHRDPRFFPDPERFEPDRFLPERSRGRHPFAFIPFSAGVRNCIGSRFALVSVKILTASVLRRFRVLPSPAGPATVQDIRLVAGVSASPRGGAPVRFQRRGPS